LPGYFQPVTLGDHQLSPYPIGPNLRPPKTYDPAEVNERLMPALAVPTRPECTNTIGLPKLCTSGADSNLFASWIDTTIPDPDAQGPIVTGPALLAQHDQQSTCTAAGWDSTHSDTFGDLQLIDTTWTGQWATPNADGHITRTIEQPADKPLDDSSFATDDGFATTAPYQLTCTINARWTKLANITSAQSAEHDVIP
jgi:hypothetical protein